MLISKAVAFLQCVEHALITNSGLTKQADGGTNVLPLKRAAGAQCTRDELDNMIVYMTALRWYLYALTCASCAVWRQRNRREFYARVLWGR
jgi:hypothetical protein